MSNDAEEIIEQFLEDSFFNDATGTEIAIGALIFLIRTGESEQVADYLETSLSMVKKVFRYE